MPSTLRILAAGLCVAAAASAGHAQVRRIGVTPAPAAPSAAARQAQSTPNPAGLRPFFPAGISSGSGAAQSGDPIASSTSPVPPGGTVATPNTTTTGGFAFNPNTTTTPTTTTPVTIVNTDGSTSTVPVVNAGGLTFGAASVMGAGATVRGPGQTTTGGAGGFSATDVARSFYFADANHDGELTRAEANRLSVRSMTFEEMDRNFDGIISRFEYEDSVR